MSEQLKPCPFCGETRLFAAALDLRWRDSSIKEWNKRAGSPDAIATDSAWRVGRKVALNVYQGERPVCQCHTPEDALAIVTAMNALAGRL